MGELKWWKVKPKLCSELVDDARLEGALRIRRRKARCRYQRGDGLGRGDAVDDSLKVLDLALLLLDLALKPGLLGGPSSLQMRDVHLVPCLQSLHDVAGGCLGILPPNHLTRNVRSG